MCQPNLNTAKTSTRRARRFIQSSSPMQHLPRNIPQHWNEIQPFLQEEPAVSHGQCKWHDFQFNTSRKIMTEINNPHWMSTTSQSHAVVANRPGVPPHAEHIFHEHLHATPHIVYQNPCDTTTPMLPHGKCVTLLSDHAIFLPHHKTYVPHHSEACHTWPPKHFQHHPTAHIFGPSIHHVKFGVALQPQFPVFYNFLLALLWIPDRPTSFLHDSSLIFLVYCCFFCLSPLLFS